MSNWKPADDGRSYADKGDSATSFNPDERFEADRAAEESKGPGCNHWPGQKRCGVCGMGAEDQAELSPAAQVCAEAYQVVGSLLSDLGQFDTDRGQHILENLSQARLVHTDVLPWPSFEQPAQSSADSAQPVAWPWRSIFNDSSWCYGPVMPTAHDQYVTEPLYVRTEPQASADRDGFDKEDFADDGAYLARFSTAPTVPQTAPSSYEPGEQDVRRFIESAVLWIPSEGVKGRNGLDATETIDLVTKRLIEALRSRCQAVSAQHRYDQDGQTCPTCGRVGNGEG
jgi:hypothetical protein